VIDRFVEIDTTRPELIPACVALVAHPDDARYQPLFGKEVETPLFGVKVPVRAHALADPDKGSGIAMICTFGDITDVTWWRELNLPVRAVIQPDGTLRDVAWGGAGWESADAERAGRFYADLKGLAAAKARVKIVEQLRESGDLVGEPRPITHAVKFYERGSRPLEIVTTRQWYIRNGGRSPELRAELIARGRELSWHPEHMRHRYENWVDGLNGDWLVSRQRFFGVPIPLWYPLDAEGRANEATATYERMKAIDPSVAPRRSTTPRLGARGGLVFLDLDEKPKATLPVQGLEPTAIEPPDAPSKSAAPEGHVVGLEPTALDDGDEEVEEEAVDPLAGLPLVEDEPPPRRTDDDYVNLADWLAEEDAGRSARMVASDERRAVEGQADFEEMLAKFKGGVAANVEDEDAESHYDLGVAYREMGLLDEAISEFQTALRGTVNSIRAYESPGQCFIDKKDFDVAQNVLSRALAEPDIEDDQLVGVLYLLGVASENLKRWADASAYYQRVVAVDIDFRDVAQRIVAVGRSGK